MKPKKVSVPESFVLGRLDKKTMLVATKHSFVLQERVKVKDESHWVGRYYYSNLPEAIKGYVRRKLRRPENAKELDGTLKALITMINNLENTVKEIGSKLSAEWEARIQDPVEVSLLNSGDDG